MTIQTLSNNEPYLDIRTKINDNFGDVKNGGFIDYNDTATASTPITLTAGVWTQVTNDGLGAFSNSTYAPPGVTTLMDTSTGSFDPRELTLGDVMFIRNDFTVTPSVNNCSLEIRYTLGTGAGAYTLSKQDATLTRGAGIGYRIALNTDKIYMGDTNTRDNLIGLEVKLSVNGTLVNAGSVISILRYTI